MQSPNVQRIAFGGSVGALALYGAYAASDQPSQRSTSVVCTGVSLMRDQDPATQPDTYDAVIRWNQEPGPQADLMRISFYNGNSTRRFPLSAVTGQEQVLQLGLTTSSSANVAVTLTDTAGGTASCPPVSVTIPR